MSNQRLLEKMLLGWSEWCALPKLGIKKIHAKVDTGARTSSLHAEQIRIVNENGQNLVLFLVTAEKREKVHCAAKLTDVRFVMSSNGSREKRCVIETNIIVGLRQWNIEITLTDRGQLSFPMLLGRTALKENCLINPARSDIQGLPQLKRAHDEN